MHTETVVALASDQTLHLATTGQAVFAEVIFPDAALAQSWMADHLVQKNLTFSVQDTDRYGRSRILSDVVPAMLRAGVAVIYATVKLPEGWAAAEASAREAKRGIWARAGWVIAAENAAQHVQEFHVVEGTITRVFETKASTYLNFGANWRNDFSVTITGRARRSMKALLPQLQAGTRVRVRGTLAEENGPMLTITRPEQLEIY